MKNLIAIITLFMLLSCNESDRDSIDDLLKQNNQYYETTLAEYKLEQNARKSDAPASFDTDFHNKVVKWIDAIAGLKDKKAYDSLYHAIHSLNYESDARKIIMPLESDNIEALKNNLYVSLMKSIRMHQLNRSVGIGTHCMLSAKFKVKKTIVNDW